MIRLSLFILLIGALSFCADRDRSRGDAAPPAVADSLLDVNGTRLYVSTVGRGPAAIVVHGGPVLDHGYLRPYMSPLESRRTLVYYDQRLSGRSAGRVDSATVRLDTFVVDLEALRSALGIERMDLIAHSWGGLLAMKYAAAHPDRLRSLILLSPMPPTAKLWQEEERALTASLEPADTAGAGALRADPSFAAGDPAAIEAVLRHSFRSQFHDPSLAKGLRFHIESDYRERSRQFGFMLPDLLAFDLRDALRGIQVPTLVLYGADEPGAEIGGRAILAALPDARLVTIPDAGHFPFIERPQSFLEEIEAFLPAGD